MVILVIALNINSSSQPNASRARYKDGSGGSPALVNSYHDQAVKAWNQGDKKKAQNIAKKGLDADYKLTREQQSEVDNQMSTMMDLNDISQGSYFGTTQ